jgi:hypothetical protein
MNLQERITFLKEQHAELHEEIENLTSPPPELKKKKLAIKDEIQDLEWADMYQGGVENFG